MGKIEFVFEALVKKYQRCIHIKVENGEIVYANECYSKARKDIVKNQNMHDLSKESTNWKAVKKYLIWFWTANRKEFCKMYMHLNMNSKAHGIAKGILKERYYELKKELEDIEELIPYIILTNNK